MGVKHLETYMKKYVPGGYIEISLIDACREYKK